MSVPALRPVFVYWNLHKHLWSVRDRETGRVIARVEALSLVGAVFVVSEAGRRRVLAEGRKNVHAGVAGSYVPAEPPPTGEVPRGGVPVTYNPRTGPHFTRRDTGASVTSAARVYLDAVTPLAGPRFPWVRADDPVSP